MAGVLKVRDGGGTLRTITAVKVRDAAGVLQTLAFIRIRDAGGVLREVFTAGGGGGGNPTYITPGSRTASRAATFKSATFEAFSSGGAPTSYAWGLLDGDGSVTAGGSASLGTLQVYAAPGETSYSIFFCDMVIGGITYRATCTFQFTNTTGDGGGGGPLP